MTAGPTNYLRKRGSRAGNRPAEQNGLSETTAVWLVETPLDQRKGLGQYMTPRVIREALLDAVDSDVTSVLDPGVGTGEFLASFRERNSSARLVGWDIDSGIVDVARKLVPSAEIRVQDALKADPAEQFDLVIGNPPYFQFSGGKDIRQRFSQVISGRPNIFALFFQIGLEVLREGGQLAYVVPTSMNSGAYFESLRQYIMRNSEIESIDLIDGSGAFADAQTTVQILVLRKGSSTGANVFVRSLPGNRRRTTFTAEVGQMESMFEGRLTLDELGFTVATGQVVWNQARDRLRPDDSEDGAVRLIWARDIADGCLAPPQTDQAKHSFVIASTPLTGPAIVVNRIVGGVGKARLRAAVVPEGLPFVGENHVNVVVPTPGRTPSISLEQLCATLRSPETGERLARITGNTQVSATELNHLLPLDITVGG